MADAAADATAFGSSCYFCAVAETAMAADAAASSNHHPSHGKRGSRPLFSMKWITSVLLFCAFSVVIPFLFLFSFQTFFVQLVYTVSIYDQTRHNTSLLFFLS